METKQKPLFTSCIIVSTPDKWGPNVGHALAHQSKPVRRLRVQDLDESPMDCSKFDLKRPQDPGLRRVRCERPGGPTEISRGWSAAEPPDRPPHTFKPRQGRQKFPMLFRFSHVCRPCRGSHGLLDGFRGFRSFLALPPANFYGPSRGRSHVRTKANPIGVAAYALQSKLPGELKGKRPTAKQLADIVRAEMEGGK